MGPLESGTGPLADAGRHHQALSDEEQCFDQDGDGGHDDRPGAQLRRVVTGLSVDDEPAKTAQPDVRGDGRRRYHLQCGGPEAEHDQRQRHRDLDPPENLSRGETHPAGRVHQGGVDTSNTDVGVDEDRWYGQEEKGEDGGVDPDPDQDGEQGQQTQGGKSAAGVAEHAQNGPPALGVTRRQAYW